ncbi:MAG: NUDIX domain-containing protein, partial [Phycisphaerae bacterium]|nr:NUDIX domain-containing protein [Phycisphaerae bacterium]
LCYLWDSRDRLLMLHRRKLPNIDMYSPIGGKLEVSAGESPRECALREIREEAGLSLPESGVRLFGIVSERAYEAQGHWLIFLYEVTSPVPDGAVPEGDFDEGRLEWVPIDEVERRNIPETDRRVMWPGARSHRGGFFMVEIDCTKSPFTHRIVESWAASQRAGGGPGGAGGGPASAASSVASRPAR